MKPIILILMMCCLGLTLPRLALGQGSVDKYIQQGHEKYDTGDLDGALADYSRAIELDPKNVIAYESRGNAKKAKGDLGGALVDYNRVIELDPKLAIGFLNRGALKGKQHDREGALSGISHEHG